MDRKPWEMTFQEYLGPAPVLGVIGPGHHAHIEAINDLADMEVESRCWQEIRVREREDLVFLAGPDERLLVLDPVSGEVIGGYANIPLVHDRYRGAGICSEMHLIRDERLGRGETAVYSRHGFRARLNAHALHIERALGRGDQVPENVLADYRVDEIGRMRLGAPYDEKDHEEWSQAFLKQRRMTDFEREMAGLTVRFRTFEGRNDPVARTYRADKHGYAFAMALHRKIGAMIRVTTTEWSLIVQAQLGDQVMDVDGIRPEGSVEDCLVARGLLDREEMDRIMVRTFPSEEEFLSVIGDRPGIVRGDRLETAVGNASRSAYAALACENVAKMGKTPDSCQELVS